MLTQEELKELLHYDPSTGVFTWRKTMRRVRKGQVAGSIMTVGYRGIRIKRKDYYAHRLVFLYMTGRFPKDCVDHKDGDGFNNVWSNLRDATYQCNNRNTCVSSNNKSGVKGVCWDKVTKKWKAQIKINRKVIYLGCFHNLTDAVQARYDAEIQYGFPVCQLRSSAKQYLSNETTT